MKVPKSIPQFQQFRFCFFTWTRGQEPNVDYIAIRFQFGRGKRFVAADSRQFGGRSYESCYFVAKRIVEMGLYFSFECECFHFLGIEYDIPAGDKGFDICKAQRFKQTAKVIHLYRVAADIDGAQKGNVFQGVLGS